MNIDRDEKQDEKAYVSESKPHIYFLIDTTGKTFITTYIYVLKYTLLIINSYV